MKQFIKNVVDRLLVEQRTAQQLSIELTDARSETRNTLNHFRLSSLLDSAPNGVPPSRPCHSVRAARRGGLGLRTPLCCLRPC
jgi:hypothetical protein